MIGRLGCGLELARPVEEFANPRRRYQRLCELRHDVKEGAGGTGGVKNHARYHDHLSDLHLPRDDQPAAQHHVAQILVVGLWHSSNQKGYESKFVFFAGVLCQLSLTCMIACAYMSVPVIDA